MSFAAEQAAILNAVGRVRPKAVGANLHISAMVGDKKNMNFKTKIQGIAGGIYRHALFYNFPGGLRFELSEGGSPLDQALSALRKAAIVCDDVFSGEERILVHLEAWLPASRFALRTMLSELKVAGIPIPKVREVWFDAECQDE